MVQVTNLEKALYHPVAIRLHTMGKGLRRVVEMRQFQFGSRSSELRKNLTLS
jgi:hypothetical protein